MQFKRTFMALMVGAAIASAPAVAAPYTFVTTGNTSVNGAYGNAITFGTTAPSTLQLSATGWQSNVFSNEISSAYLGAYGGGLGVTGNGDYSGAYNLHQIDNVGNYTDFVMLEFNRPVTLASVTTNSYGIGSITDNDAVWYDASRFMTAEWNTTTGFAGKYVTAPSLWSDLAPGAALNAVRSTGAVTASTKWLVGAAFGPYTDRQDGFKIAAITVNEPGAVPEPATWATMILGLGLVGAALRRRRRTQIAIA